MSQEQLAEQIVDLQSRISFQEDTLLEMSQQLALQAEQLRVAQQHIQHLNGKLNGLMANLDQSGVEGLEEKPPHY